MRLKLLAWASWNYLHHSYWFIPALMLAAAAMVSTATLEADRRATGLPRADLGWLYTGSAEGARQLLGTIASSAISVAGVVFSVTIVALTLAARRFGPRVLRGFMRDTGNQLVLGNFLATFLYSILIMRQIHEAGGDLFIPQISILLAVLLMIASLALLIYFIHHIAESIQTPYVLSAIMKELRKTVAETYRVCDFSGKAVSQADLQKQAEADDEPARDIQAQKTGYLLRVEIKQLFQDARRHDLTIKVNAGVGNFVLADDVVIRVWPANRVTPALVKRLTGTFTLGSQRSSSQDVEFVVGELVEIAVLALAPGLGDPFTVKMCIERLTEGMADIVRRERPLVYLADDSNKLRLITSPQEPVKLLNLVFNQIRWAHRGSIDVTLALIQSLTRIAAHTDDTEIRAALAGQAQMVFRQAIYAAQEEQDREAAKAACRQSASGVVLFDPDAPRLNDGSKSCTQS